MILAALNNGQFVVAVIVAYLVLLLGLGVVSNRFFRGTAADYFLASRGIGSFLLLMSLFGTTMTAFALVGSTGQAFKDGIGVYGLMASSSGIVHSMCFFLVGIRLWSFGKRFGYTTQIQFFRDRFESDKLGLVLFPILVGLIVPYLLIGVIGAGATIERVTEGAFPSVFPAHGVGAAAVQAGAIPFWIGAGVVCCVVLIYVFFGGVRGTAWANTFQTLIFIILGLVCFLAVADRFGGMRNATVMVAERNPEKLCRTVAEDGPQVRYRVDKALYEKKLAAWEAAPEFERGARPAPPKAPVTMSRVYFLSYLLIPLSIGMFPHIFQHWLTAKSAKSFRLAVVAHPILILLVWLPCILMGVWATSAMIDGQPAIPYGFANPNAVLGKLVADLHSNLLPGLLTAGILAAIMSSLDSQFLCLGSIFTNDIVAHYFGRDRLTDRQRVVTGRVFVVIVVVVSYLLALTRPGGVFTLGIWCFTGFAGLFPLVIAALYWRRVTKAGAYACILTTGATWFALFRASGWAGDDDYMYMGVPPVAIVVGASALALVVVSVLTRAPTAATIERFFGRTADARRV